MQAFGNSNKELKLDRYTRITLSENANCSMAENSDPENWETNICITGGIWDMNHIYDCDQINLTDQTIQFLKNEADIKHLMLENILADGKAITQ